jgi:glycosyltransferase involved in cell wall biosynthesis
LLLLLPQLIINRNLSQQGRKILFISLTRTGSTAYASAIADALSAYDPIIVTSRTAEKNFTQVDQAVETYSGTLSFIIKSLPFFIKAASLLKNYNDKEKVILYLPVFHPWNLFLAMWAAVYGIPVITTVHDYHTHIGEKSTVTEIIQKLQMMISDKVIFLTDYQRQEALKELTRKDKEYIVLPHPIIKSGIIHNLDHSKEMKFLFLGRIKAYKGYSLVLDSAENKHIYQITIAGTGNHINTTNSKISLIDRHLTDLEISELLSTHHVLLLPYKETSQSGILTLGIDSGMPIIISRLPGLQEQLDEECVVWIEPTSDGLIQAMSRIQSDKRLYDNIKAKVKSYKSVYQNNFQEKLDQLLDSLHRL